MYFISCMLNSSQKINILIAIQWNLSKPAISTNRVSQSWFSHCFIRENTWCMYNWHQRVMAPVLLTKHGFDALPWLISHTKNYHVSWSHGNAPTLWKPTEKSKQTTEHNLWCDQWYKLNIQVFLVIWFCPVDKKDSDLFLGHRKNWAAV